MESPYALVACVALAGALLAQDAVEPSLQPDGSLHVGINGIRILPATGKPFSGVDSIQWTRNLEDGTTVATHQDARLARDSEGRIYRENVTRFPANSDRKSRVKQFIIFDPVAHTRTVCVPAARRCEVNDYHVPRSSAAAKPIGTFNTGKGQLTRESLGTDTIEGLNVAGTRETLTIDTGAEGNSQPLSTVEESWYSPDLEVNLSITRKDPREGTIAIHVIDLSTSEPDPSLFRIPANFTVEDQRRPAKSEN